RVAGWEQADAAGRRRRLELGQVVAQQPRLARADVHLGEVRGDLVPQAAGVGLGEPGPLGEVARLGGAVEAEEAADGLPRGGAAPRAGPGGAPRRSAAR